MRLSFEIWKFWRGRIADFRINSTFFCERNRGRPWVIIHLIVQLISLCFGAFNPQEILLYILNLFRNKLNEWIKFAKKLVSLSTGSRNEISKNLYSIHRNTCINSANGRSYVMCLVVFVTPALNTDNSKAPYRLSVIGVKVYTTQK